jgi:hypothetical protein
MKDSQHMSNLMNKVEDALILFRSTMSQFTLVDPMSTDMEPEIIDWHHVLDKVSQY